MPTPTDLPADLPFAVAAYFVAENAGGHAAMAACFDADAEVADEGREHRGPAAIEAWARDAAAKYRHRVLLLDARREGGECTVTARVSGDFPGSPLALRFRFTLRGAHIARLQIQP
ncbi:MAG: nuclear transport factor 2 family protein [Myxococcota bacterium]